jgi:SRSO17 transposase
MSAWREGQMTVEEFSAWADSFNQMHARFGRFFARSETREAARQYLRGLLSSAARKNCWQMAEAVGETDPQSLQRLLWDAVWEAEAVLEELQGYVGEELGEPSAIGVLDETSFVKKGQRSVGVKRQWCSPLGKTENCQVGVFLSYVTARG